MSHNPVLYGEQTRRAIQNFPISGWSMPQEIIRALALIKEHAAVVNGELGVIPKSYVKVISDAARRIKEGEFSDQFPVDVFQTGSGTSTNMNVNEVIASLASTPIKGIHPNDHVNRCQSSNDTIPTAIQIACALKVRDELIPALEMLKRALNRKAREFKLIIKTARTHLMDAVPVSLGDEFEAFVALVDHAIDELKHSQNNLCVLPLGGTAAGTGANAHPKFAGLVIDRINEETGLALEEAKNHISAQSCPLVTLELSGCLRSTSAALNKIANDIRWMSSGPTAGLNELKLPALQAGSSIMPGKVNPVICESVMQVGMYVEGADTTVRAGIREGSAFELNTAYPVIAQSLIMSLRLITNVTNAFVSKCVDGIKANEKAIASKVERNAMLATALAPIIGYDKAAEIAKEAMEKDLTIYEVAQQKIVMPENQLKKLLDINKMV
ncbi:class II fumarate hydratase [Patescibacteria group bacterium]|nr:class II fumarate hydratase [Patescibacteria group bacterium]MBU1123105.1 class II fumarate hydratase [Patescibacteria group bacterium]MBU1911769.1 class II fumarate hydratase [Patescibacteria group bacterium]